LNFNNTPIDWNQVNDVILSTDRIMLTTHENPDGDGLGAEVGIYYHLNEIGKDVRIINYSPLPKEYEYLNKENIFETYSRSEHDQWLQSVDIILIFDVGDFDRVKSIKDAIEKYKIKTMNIDHHPHPDTHPFTYNLVDLSAAATGCMVYDYLKVVRNNPITKYSLLGIYTAVMTDTGCFKYSNTDMKCHEIAIESLQNGIETYTIYQNIYENSTRPRMQLLGEFLSNLHYELDGQFAWFVISQEMMINADASKTDVEGFTDIVRTISGVEVAVMIFEKNNLECRVNFRSKGKFIINDIAQLIGGGGHAFAAGAMVNGVLDETIKKVVGCTISSLKTKMNGIK